ncbi:MAG: ATP-dependent 6-phosphofructokinase, partial [Proteobacteria bacterium]|nr:ATP-dependent 6-phosphofructokinase [Pseudomonadota bacterium]
MSTSGTPKRLAVLTSGGDAPGMNAAIRAVTRAALDRGWTVLGVANGYAGLLAGTVTSLDDRAVGGILQRGGTILGSSRCPQLATEAGQLAAVDVVRRLGIDALVVIGGNGSQSGAAALAGRGLAVVGVASTIDNDLLGCDVTIGTTSAVDVAVEAIDRLKVTASSHHRAFLVEVMGRACGYLALTAGIAGGAEAIVLPEVAVSHDDIARVIRDGYQRGKAHAIVVVAEGAPGGADGLAAELVRDRIGFDARVVKLGHVQRGAAPASFDRMLASRTGAAAVAALARGVTGVVIGIARNVVVETPLAEVAGRTKGVDRADL